jgi:hypothetical protein
VTKRQTKTGDEFDAVCRCSYHRAFPITGRSKAKRTMRRRERHEARKEMRHEEPKA